MSKLNIFLLIAAMISAFAVVLLRDETRKNYIALEQTRKAEKALNDEHTRLLLEQINLSKHAEVEVQAQKQGLRAPTVDEVGILEP